MWIKRKKYNELIAKVEQLENKLKEKTKSLIDCRERLGVKLQAQVKYSEALIRLSNEITSLKSKYAQEVERNFQLANQLAQKEG